MTDLRDFYQEIILDHYRKPRNFSPLESATCQARGHNPLCGDRVEVYLHIDTGVVREISFQGAGCAISTASASLMTEAVKGMTLVEACALFDSFHDMMTGTGEASDPIDLGKLEALSGVRQIPIRVKCATLAWHTLKAALEESNNNTAASISTE